MLDDIADMIIPKGICRVSNGTNSVSLGQVALSNDLGDSTAEVILDYGRCEGGTPVFEIQNVKGRSLEIKFRVIYSETIEGIDKETGMRLDVILRGTVDSCQLTIVLRGWPIFPVLFCNGFLQERPVHRIS
jgi:hypothetical protein